MKLEKNLSDVSIGFDGQSYLFEGKIVFQKVQKRDKNSLSGLMT